MFEFVTNPISAIQSTQTWFINVLKKSKRRCHKMHFRVCTFKWLHNTVKLLTNTYRFIINMSICRLLSFNVLIFSFRCISLISVAIILFSFSHFAIFPPSHFLPVASICAPSFCVFYPLLLFYEEVSYRWDKIRASFISYYQIVYSFLLPMDHFLLIM